MNLKNSVYQLVITSDTLNENEGKYDYAIIIWDVYVYICVLTLLPPEYLLSK